MVSEVYHHPDTKIACACEWVCEVLGILQIESIDQAEQQHKCLRNPGDITENNIPFNND